MAAELIPLRPIVTAQAPKPNLSGEEIAAPFASLSKALTASGSALETVSEGLAQKAGEEEGRKSVRVDDSGNLVVSDTRNPFIIGPAAGRYERAAKMTQLAQMQPKIETDMLKLRLDHPNDPGGFAAAAKGYATTMLNGDPDKGSAGIQDPALRGAVSDILHTNQQHNERTSLVEANAHNTSEALQTYQASIRDLNEQMSSLARQGGTGTPEYLAKARDRATFWNNLQGDPRFKFSKERADLEVNEAFSQDKVQEVIGKVQRQYMDDKDLPKAKQALQNAFWGEGSEKLNLTAAKRDHGVAEGIHAITNLSAVDHEAITENRKATAGWITDTVTRPRGFDLGQALNLRQRSKDIGDDRSVHEIDEAIRFQPLAQAYHSASPSGRAEMLGEIQRGVVPAYRLQSSFQKMLDDAPPEVKQGVSVFSGTRTPEHQAELYAAAVKKYGSEEEARKWVAPPGHSQHEKGNAADLRFASPEARDWVHANAKNYGLAFPLGNEPWHIEMADARGGVGAVGRSNLDAAQKEMNLTPQERSLYERHLTNLTGPGGVDNPNGSRSTLFQMSFERDGKTYNIPTVWDGKILKPDDAIARAEKEGLSKFPSYKNEGEAEARYEQMHKFMERDTGAYLSSRQRIGLAEGQRIDLGAATPTARLFESVTKDLRMMVSKDAEQALARIEKNAKEGATIVPDDVQHFAEMASRSGRDDLIEKARPWLSAVDINAGRPPGQTIDVLKGQIAELRAKGIDPMSADTLDHVETLGKAHDERFKENPRVEAANSGWVGAPGQLALDNPQAFGAEIAAREKNTGVIQQHVPNIGPMSAIMPAEGKRLATALTGGDPKVASGLLDSLQANLSHENWRATMAQPAVKDAVIDMMNSNDPARMDAGGMAMDKLWSTNEPKFKADYGDAALNRLMAWKGLQALTPQERTERLNKADDPNTARSRRDIGGEVEHEMKSWTVNDVAYQLGSSFGIPIVSRVANVVTNATPKAPVDGVQAGAMKFEFENAVKQMRMYGVPPSRAQSLAVERMKAEWQPSKMLGYALMKNAPEAYYPADPISKTQDWMRTQLEDDITRIHGAQQSTVALEGGSTTLPGWTLKGIVSDDRTEQDIKAGRPPSYQIAITDAKGQDQFLANPDTGQTRYVWDPSKMLKPRQDEAMGRFDRFRASVPYQGVTGPM